MDWTEELTPPLLPHLGWVLQRPVIAHLYQRDLYLLRDLCEDAADTRDVPEGADGTDRSDEIAGARSDRHVRRSPG